MTIHGRARAAWAEIPVPAPTEPSRPMRRVFVRDLLLNALIGIYPHERVMPQNVRINMDLWVADTPGMPPRDRKSVVEGKSVSVRVDLGGRRIIKKKNNIYTIQ